MGRSRSFPSSSTWLWDVFLVHYGEFHQFNEGLRKTFSLEWYRKTFSLEHINIKMLFVVWKCQ